MTRNNNNNKGNNILPKTEAKDTRKEILFVVGRELEENIMVDIHWNDLNDFAWKYQNYFEGDHALIYSN